MKEWIELVSSQIVHLWIVAGVLIAWNAALSIMVLYAIHRKPNAPADLPAVAGKVRRDVVCLCGSTRFRDEFTEANRRETMAGKIVLAPGVFGHSGDPLTDADKDRLDRLHFEKIDMADSVTVVNPGGYIGDSTRREIAYAESTGKPVVYTHNSLLDRSHQSNSGA